LDSLSGLPINIVISPTIENLNHFWKYW